MDTGKAKALVDWVNTLAVGDCIEGISQLQDGKIFCNIINLCDHDFNADDLSSNEERFAKLITFLEGQYETRLQTKIDLQCALSGNQFELGKVCLLLMSCTVMCVNNDQIMERTLKLDTIDQMHVRDMIEYVLLPNSQLTGLESTFYQILCRPIDSRDGHISTLNSSSSTSSSTNVLHRFASPRGFIINSSTCMSPVQQMMQSPNMASKIREDQRIKRLRRDLEAEKKKRHGLEEAMLDKEEEMIKKESELEEVEVKLRQLQKHCNKINEHLNIVTQHQAEGKQHAADQEKINYLHKEMRELQDRNKILSTENCQMSSEYTAFKEQSEKLSVVRKQKADLSTRIIELEVNLSEVTDQLEERSSNLETLQANYNTVVTEIENEREWYKEMMNDVQAKKGNDSSVLMRSIGGDCMAGVIDLKLQELEMELANGTAIRKTLKAELDSALNSIARSGERTQTLESQNGELTKSHNVLLQQIADLEQQKLTEETRLQQELQQLGNALSKVESMYEESERKWNEQISAVNAELDARQTRVNDLEAELRHRDGKIEQCEKVEVELRGELNAQRQQCDEYLAKVLKMKDELTGSDSAASKYEQQCMLWEQRNADLTAKFEANNLTKDQEYHRELSEREDELDNLQGELENTNSELTELRKELASARSELKLRAQKIEQQVVEQRELCSQYQERLSAVEQQSMQEVKAVLTAKEKELEQIMSQQEQHANEQRREQSHNAKHVETLLTSAQTDKMRLQQDMGQLERQYVNDRETYQANLTARATEIEHLRQTLAHEQQVAQTQLKEYESTMMTQISEQKQRVQDVSAHLAEHKDEIERLNSALRKQEVASQETQQAHKQEMESLQTDLQNLFTENNTLRCLEASSREKQVTIECLEKDKLELIEHGCKEQRSLRQEYDSTVSNMKQQFTDLSTDKEQLANRLGELTEQHRVLIDETREQRMTLTRYEEERKVLQQSKVKQAKSAAQLVKLQQEVEHMLSQQESGEAEIRQLRSSQSRRMSAAKLKHAQLQEQMTHQQTDVSDNDERLEALIASVSRLATYQEERKHKHSKELSDIRQKYKQQLDNVVSQWQQKYDKLVLNNNKCKDQSSTLAKQYDSMMEECEKRLTKKREELRGARAELQGERAGLLDMEAELRGARAELQGRNENVRQLDEQLQSLTQQLTEFRSKILALTSENESLSKEIELLKALGASQTSQMKKETTFTCNLGVEDDVMMDTESAPMSLDELGSERDFSSDSRRSSGVSTRSMDSSRRGSGVSTRSLSVSHPHPHPHPQLSRLSISSPSLTNSMRRESSSNLHNRPSNSQRTTRLSSSAMSLPAQTQSKQNVTFKSPAFKSPAFKSPNPRRTSGRLSSSAHDTRSKMSRLSIGATASASFEPSRSATLPRSMLFEEEDESHIFDWDRMSELNRRNTLCLPHLKTSYPVETQTKALQEFNEKTLQSGTLKESTSIKPISTTATLLSSKQQHPGGGRHPGVGHPQPPSDTFNNLMNPPVETKTPRTKRKYTAQLVKAFTKSHKSTPNKKNRSTPTRKSPRTPSTPPITPRRSGRTPQSKMNQENQDSKKKNPVSFNIGFTPTRSVKRLSNLVSRKRQASSTTTVLGGPPLGTSSLPGPTGPSGSAATPKMFKRPLTDFTNNTLFK